MTAIQGDHNPSVFFVKSGLNIVSAFSDLVGIVVVGGLDTHKFLIDVVMEGQLAKSLQTTSQEMIAITPKS